MRLSNSLLLAVVAVLGASGTGRADPYRSAEHHFTLELPSGWEILPDDDLNRANDGARREFPGMDVTMVVGFRPAKGDPARTGFVLVQLDKRATNKTPFEEFQRDMANDLAGARRGEPEAKLRLTRRLIQPDDKPEFDEARGRYVIRRGAGTSSAKGQIASSGYLGPDGLVIVHAFVRSSGTAAEPDPVSKLCDSFRFDESEKPVPTVVDKLFGDEVGPVGRMAIIGGGVALLVVAVGAVALREKPKPNWPHRRAY
jgi:hypothetical protein